MVLFKRSIHFRYDKDSRIFLIDIQKIIKWNFMLQRLLHTILRLKNSEAMTDFKPFQKKFRNFTKKQPENMLVFNSSYLLKSSET